MIFSIDHLWTCAHSNDIVTGETITCTGTLLLLPYMDSSAELLFIE